MRGHLSPWEVVFMPKACTKFGSPGGGGNATQIMIDRMDSRYVNRRWTDPSRPWVALGQADAKTERMNTEVRAWAADTFTGELANASARASRVLAVKL